MLSAVTVRYNSKKPLLTFHAVVCAGVTCAVLCAILYSSPVHCLSHCLSVYCPAVTDKCQGFFTVRHWHTYCVGLDSAQSSRTHLYIKQRAFPSKTTSLKRLHNGGSRHFERGGSQCLHNTHRINRYTGVWQTVLWVFVTACARVSVNLITIRDHSYIVGLAYTARRYYCLIRL